MEQLAFIEGLTQEDKIPKNHSNNLKTIARCLGASNMVESERETNDFYATDPIAIEYLMQLEHLNSNIWECACGEGHLAKPLIRSGFNVRCTDLIDRGFGKGGVNFFLQTEKWHGDIVTNPPYKYAQEFIEHSLELVDQGNKVCMFLKVQFLEGQRRRRLFDTQPPRRIWVSSSRIDCSKNGGSYQSSMIAYGWFVWEKGYQGTTEIGWFN